MSLLLLTVSAMICLLASLFFLLSPSSSFDLKHASQKVLPAYLQTHHNGWGGLENGGGEGEWDLFYHLGGNGPWIEKKTGILEGGISVPEGCEVDMVHMMSRHGERYPTKGAGYRMLDLLTRIKSTNTQFTDALSFLNDYNYITDSPDLHFEQLTSTGPYSGTLETFTTGVKLSTRYQHLWNNSNPIKTLIWAGDSERVIDTARYFAAGFFGLNSDYAEVVVISEGPEREGDTLTPGETCKKYITDKEDGHDLGYFMRDTFSATYLPAISERLSAFTSSEFKFTNSEIFTLQETCGFETLVRGASPFCKLFSRAEWEAFEYARDIIHYYRSGPGNKYAKAMGWLWLNATMNLIEDGPQKRGPFFASFVHDGDIVPLLATLGLFDDRESEAVFLPVNSGAEQVDWVEQRNWRTSTITPMGGRILFERMKCGKGASTEGLFIRFNVNDGIVPLEDCKSGPGGSCEIGSLRKLVNKRGEDGGDFREICGLGEDAKRSLGFLRQPAYDRM